jgi:hypothetical protein
VVRTGDQFMLQASMSGAVKRAVVDLPRHGHDIRWGCAIVRSCDGAGVISHVATLKMVSTSLTLTSADVPMHRVVIDPLASASVRTE